MKRALIAQLFLSVTLLATSCAKTTNSNEAAIAPPVNKPLRITITYSDATPEQFRIDVDDGIRISKTNKDTIKWKVKYVGPGSGNAAEVTLDDFKSGSESNPFGDGSQEKNRFKFDPEANGPDKTGDTDSPSKIGDFKYRISVKLPNGKVIIVDPVVIIDN